MPHCRACQVDRHVGVGLVSGQVGHLQQLVVFLHRAAPLVTIGLGGNVRLVPDDPAVNSPGVHPDHAAHKRRPQVARVVHRQIQAPRDAAARRPVGRPGGCVLQQADHLTPLSGGPLQPHVLDVIAVPVVGAVGLQLRPIEQDPLPGHTGLCRGRRVPERLDRAETGVGRGLLRHHQCAGRRSDDQ